MNTVAVRVNPYYNHPDYFSSNHTFHFIVSGRGELEGGGSVVLAYSGSMADNSNTNIIVASGGGGGSGFSGGAYKSVRSICFFLLTSIGFSFLPQKIVNLGSKKRTV